MDDAGRKDDPSVADDEELWRRVTPDQIIFDNNTQAHRPSSAAFRDHPRRDAMSVYLAGLVRESGRTSEQLLEEYPGYGLVSFPAGVAREVGLGVTHERDVEHPEEEAHAVVFGKKTGSVRKKLVKASKWIVLPADVS